MTTAAEAARHIFISETRFRQLVDAGTIERQPPGQYDLDVVRKAAFEQLRATASARGSSVKLSDERALLAKRQRELTELKIAKARGAVVEIETVGELLENRYAIVRERLFELPHRVADKIEGLRRNDIVAALNQAIIEVLNELYKPARILEEALERSGDGDSPSSGAGGPLRSSDAGVSHQDPL
jgi:hypothetical protein